MSDTDRPDPIQPLVEAMLKELGEEPGRDGLLRTPPRVAKSLRFLTQGYRQDPRDVLNDALFDVTYDEMVIVRDIELYSLCEHHMLPFFGRAHVAYIPRRGGTVTGLSKLTRLVDGYSRRPQVQERLTSQVASAIQDTLHPQGTLVVIEAEHLCMSMRGVRKPGAVTVTSAVHGVFRDEVSTRLEAMRFIEGRRS